MKIQLRNARIAAKLTQYQVAEKLGISSTTMSQIEGGSRKLSLVKALELAEIYGVEAHSIFADLGRYKVNVKN